MRSIGGRHWEHCAESMSSETDIMRIWTINLVLSSSYDLSPQYVHHQLHCMFHLLNQPLVHCHYLSSRNNMSGRHRWVNFAEIRREASHGPSIPPGWFGWMHHARCNTPADPKTPKPPKWVLLHAENFTGTDKAYLPTNYGQNTSQAWKGLRYQPWDPYTADADEDSEENMPRIGL